MHLEFEQLMHLMLLPAIGADNQRLWSRLAAQVVRAGLIQRGESNNSEESGVCSVTFVSSWPRSVYEGV